jgi:hypothetical protein
VLEWRVLAWLGLVDPSPRRECMRLP